MSTLEITAEELSQHHLVDRGLLKPGGRRELLQTMAELRAQGRTAFLLLLPRAESTQPWRQLGDRLALEDRRNLLLLFNGDRWEARGWGLEGEVIAQNLTLAEPDLGIYYARGLVKALRLLAEASGLQVAEATEPDDEPAIWLPASAGAVVLTGAVAWVIRRRAERAHERRKSFERALKAARKTFTDVILGGDEVPLDNTEEATRIQLRADELNRELDTLEREVSRDPQRYAKPQTLGRLQHIHDEMTVLASSMLQKRR